MKFIAFTIGLLLMVTISVMAGKVEHTYHFGNPSVQQTGEYQRFEFENTMLTALPGQPILPYRQVNLLLPPGEAAIGIDIVFSDEVTLPGKYNLYPQQDVRPVSAGKSGVFIKDNVVYSSNALFPANPKGQLLTAFLNGRSLALTSFTPARYNPVTGQLSYYATVNVIVKTVSDSKAVMALRNLVQKNNVFFKHAENIEMDRSYSLKRIAETTKYDMLIITTAEFKGAFTGMQAYYLKEGIASEVVTLDSIASVMAGVDTPEKIRNFIIQEYQLHGIQYVLLGGDDELIPHRGLYCYVQSGSGYTDNNIPSDLYYSALDGNWNADGDALWGEPGEEDLLPEVAVGRFVFSNASELEHMLNKSYKYQFEPVLGEFRNILMAGENLYQNPVSWGSDYLNLLKGLQSENGYTTTGIPSDYSFDNMYDEVANWTAQDLMNHLNHGRPMLNHAGHSSKNYVMKLIDSDITNANFSGLNGVDHNFTIVYTHGCDCGAFDYSDCIAEKMVSINNFAVAFIGNSRYGWFNEGQTEGPSAHLHREFMDALYADSLNRIGRAHMESKIASAAWVTAPGQWEPGALRWCFYDCNLLGDPALAVFTDNPISINTVYPSTVALDATSMNVSVTSSGLPPSELTCVAIKDRIIIGKSLTDKSGNGVIHFDKEIKESGAAQLIVSGYNCVPVTYDFGFLICIGFDELSGSQANMSIWPNPARGRTTIDIALAEKCNFVLKVYNDEGKAMITEYKNSTDGNGRFSKSLDISSLKHGSYTCEIKSDKCRFSKQLIVN